MDIKDKQYAIVVINYFWGAGTANLNNINEDAIAIAFQALAKAGACTESMNLVPRPASTKANMSYIFKQINAIGKRIQKGDTKIYSSCKNSVAVAYKSRILMALAGI